MSKKTQMQTKKQTIVPKRTNGTVQEMLLAGKLKKKGKKKRANPKERRVRETLPPTLVTPIADLKLAQGVSSTIVIETQIDQDAFSFIPVGLVSLALNRGYDTPYLFYLGIYQDISDIAQGGPGKATNRLRYMNDIFNALAPKSIPFRTKGTIGYKFTNFPTIDPTSFVYGWRFILLYV